jgi:hypothetical protein
MSAAPAYASCSINPKRRTQKEMQTIREGLYSILAEATEREERATLDQVAQMFAGRRA